VIDLGLVMIGLPFLLVPNWEGPLTNRFCLNGQDLSLNVENLKIENLKVENCLQCVAYSVA
jgi:hypothetical protein